MTLISGNKQLPEGRNQPLPALKKIIQLSI